MRWRNVDLNMSTISVTQTLHRLSNGQYVTRQPKSSKSRCQVDLPPTLALLLRQHKADQELEKILVGRPLADSDLVFSHPDGSPLDPHVVSHAFSKVICKTGLPDIRFHDIRHTHATLLLKVGIHPKIVSERLEHASIGITLDTYSHVLPGLQEAAAERFDEMLELVNR